MGINAVTAIITERNANGPFKDIYDFVERVNLSSCNRSSIENLALAGAFDSMGYMREIFVEPMFDTTYADMLVKYGQTIQNDKNSLQVSLFGDLEPIDTAKPPIPVVEPWNRMKLLDEEKKLVTIYLSAHPLDPYYMELKYGCNCQCAELEEKKVPGAKLTMGGLVTAFNIKVSKNGNQYGQLTVEDFSGAVSFNIFGKAFEAHKNKFVVGDAVYLKVNVVPGKWDPTRIETSIDEVYSLSGFEGKMANSVSIYLDHRFNTEDFFQKLRQFNPQQRPGDLYLEIYNPETRQIIKVHSRRKFPITKELIDFFEDWGIKYKVTTE